MAGVVRQGRKRAGRSGATARIHLLQRLFVSGCRELRSRPYGRPDEQRPYRITLGRLRRAVARVDQDSNQRPGSGTLARWESDGSSLTLLRAAYAPAFQLVLLSKRLSTEARSAIQEAIRLDAIEAPRREMEQHDKRIADISAAREKARTTNTAAFRP